MPGPVCATTYNSFPEQIASGLVGHTVEEVECELILRTLAYHNWNRTRAAKALGISLRTMRNKIHVYQALGIVVRGPTLFSKRYASDASATVYDEGILEV